MYTFCKELLLESFVYSYFTPVAKVFSGKKILKEFYNFSQFQDWIQQQPPQSNLRVKYYKGLGTSTDEEARESFKNFYNNMFIYKTDEKDQEVMKQAFCKDNSHDRKAIIQSYESQYLDYQNQKEVCLNQFVSHELSHFWIADNKRSIPCLYDGLKDSQRKIIVTAQHFLSQETKVGVFAGKVISETDYHHGEQSLQDAIILMSQNFQNTNNINYFEPVGQFGNIMGLDAAQPRYIFIKERKLVQLIYPKKLNKVLEFDISETENNIVPKHLFSVIPMILVNGCEGIGTGYSSSLCKFHPIEMAKYVCDILDQQDVSKTVLKPYFKYHNRNFKKISDNEWLHTVDYVVNRKKNLVTLSQLPLGKSYE